MTQQASDTDVRVTVAVNAPIERAFRVFTERWDAWWPSAYRLGGSGAAEVVLERRVGGRWFERGADGTECDWGRVLVWDPPHRIALSWQIGVGFVPEPDPERASRVDVAFLEEGPGRTVVTLVHSGFERHGEGWESTREGVAHRGGWPGILEAYAQQAAA